MAENVWTTVRKCWRKEASHTQWCIRPRATGGQTQPGEWNMTICGCYSKQVVDGSLMGKFRRFEWRMRRYRLQLWAIIVGDVVCNSYRDDTVHHHIVNASTMSRWLCLRWSTIINMYICSDNAFESDRSSRPLPLAMLHYATSWTS